MHFMVPLVYGPDDRRHEQDEEHNLILSEEFREPTSDEQVCTRNAELQRDELQVAPSGSFVKEVHGKKFQVSSFKFQACLPEAGFKTPCPVKFA